MTHLPSTMPYFRMTEAPIQTISSEHCRSRMNRRAAYTHSDIVSTTRTILGTLKLSFSRSPLRSSKVVPIRRVSSHQPLLIKSIRSQTLRNCTVYLHSRTIRLSVTLSTLSPLWLQTASSLSALTAIRQCGNSAFSMTTICQWRARLKLPTPS